MDFELVSAPIRALLSLVWGITHVRFREGARATLDFAAPVPAGTPLDPQEVDVHRVLIAVSESEIVNELPIPAVAVGALGFGALLALLALTYAFRNVGNRH